MRRVRSRDHRAESFSLSSSPRRTSPAACGCCGGRVAPRRERDHRYTTGHVWDEDLRELNNPLPRWWLWLFIITVVFSVVYLLLYPGLGTFKGTLNWTLAQRTRDTVAPQRRAHRTYAGAVQRARRRRTHSDPARSSGRNLFLNNCATCHGSDGGARRLSQPRRRGLVVGWRCRHRGRDHCEWTHGVMPPWGRCSARAASKTCCVTCSVWAVASSRRVARGPVRVRRAVRRVPWRRRQGQPGAGRAQSHRRLLAARRRSPRCADSIEKGARARCRRMRRALGETRASNYWPRTCCRWRHERRSARSAGDADEQPAAETADWPERGRATGAIVWRRASSPRRGTMVCFAFLDPLRLRDETSPEWCDHARARLRAAASSCSGWSACVRPVHLDRAAARSVLIRRRER